MSEGGKTARSDLWGGAAWLVFGLLIAGESLRMDRFEAVGAQLYAMPGFVPGLIGAVVALLGAVLMLRGWVRGRGRRAIGDAAPPAPMLNRRVLLALALMLVYAGVLLGRTPFWLATALFVAAFVALYAPADRSPARRALQALVAGGLTALVVTLVFEQVFLVRLP